MKVIGYSVGKYLHRGVASDSEHCYYFVSYGPMGCSSSFLIVGPIYEEYENA